jgi:hypothetical protein
LSSAQLLSLILGQQVGREEAVSEEQIIGFLKEAEGGVPVKELAL